MMAFTKWKTATINLGYFLSASIFGLFAAYFALKSGSHLEDAWWKVVVPGIVAVVVAAFPVWWLFFPNKHPVRRALAAHGNAEDIGSLLNSEMECRHEICGPFHFTNSLLVYEPGYSLDVVPYETIVAAEIVMDSTGEGPATPKIVLTTREGKIYQWYRTWMQGKFDPSLVLAKIQCAARLATRSQR